jgi:hypothetical protein
VRKAQPLLRHMRAGINALLVPGGFDVFAPDVGAQLEAIRPAAIFQAALVHAVGWGRRASESGG